MRAFEKIWVVGWILRALWMGMTAIYAGIMLRFGGHRSIFSHGLIIGTIGRMIFFNIPIWFVFYWVEMKKFGYYDFSNVYQRWSMQYWLFPYYLSQFLMLNIGDSIHILLDTEIVKNILYVPETTRTRISTNFKPKYGKFIEVAVMLLFSYVYNKIDKIKTLKIRGK